MSILRISVLRIAHRVQVEAVGSVLPCPHGGDFLEFFGGCGVDDEALTPSVNGE